MSSNWNFHLEGYQDCKKGVSASKLAEMYNCRNAQTGNILKK